MIDEVNAAARLIAAYLTTAADTTTGVVTCAETCATAAEQSTKPTAAFASPSTISLASSSHSDDVITSATSALHNTTKDDGDHESSATSSDKQDNKPHSTPCASLSHKPGNDECEEIAEGANSGVDWTDSSGESEAEKCDKQQVGDSDRLSLVDSISAALQAKFHGHWYPLLPSKGSGYRCLKFGAQYLDGAIVSACESCGIDRAEIITSIPNDLILWIDPGEVSPNYF